MATAMATATTTATTTTTTTAGGQSSEVLCLLLLLLLLPPPPPTCRVTEGETWPQLGGYSLSTAIVEALTYRPG
ncbi:hypothetical protein M0804_015214 [Polistes exclamans]|nr:hypothetical protein M0804_015214 [Polistes exclamans]